MQDQNETLRKFDSNRKISRDNKLKPSESEAILVNDYIEPVNIDLQDNKSIQV